MYFGVNGQKISKKDYLVTLKTSEGTMHLILFDDTPKHKTNFLKLAEDGFYNGTLFHRVKNEFMIQGEIHLPKQQKKAPDLGQEEVICPKFRMSSYRNMSILKEPWQPPEPATRQRNLPVASSI